MSDRTELLAGIFERAEHVHSVMAEKTGGADPDWALFYGWWLLNWSDFSAASGRTPPLAGGRAWRVGAPRKVNPDRAA